MQEHFQRYLWINIGIILGSFLIFGAIFYFLSHIIDDKVTKILASRTAIAQRSTDLETFNKLKTDTAAATGLQKKIDALLPPQDNLIGFPQFMNTLARGHSLSIVFNFEGAPVQPAPPAPGYVNFSAIIEGSAADIRSYVDELENKTTKFMVSLQKIVMTPRAEIYYVEIRGQVFFQDNKTNPT